VISLNFKGATSRSVGPLAWIECSGGTVFLPDSPQPVGEYRLGSWVYQGERYAQVECRSMLYVRFRNPEGAESPLLGPRTFVCLRGPYAFAGRALIAKLDSATQVWIQTGTSVQWSVMRIETAPKTLKV
jgi:hypothetical protein